MMGELMGELQGFNSNLVRLKGYQVLIFILSAILFQFQSGAIKRTGPAIASMALSVSFNSNLVRLKELAVKLAAKKEAFVSIPIWCD